MHRGKHSHNQGNGQMEAKHIRQSGRIQGFHYTKIAKDVRVYNRFAVCLKAGKTQSLLLV